MVRPTVGSRAPVGSRLRSKLSLEQVRDSRGQGQMYVVSSPGHVDNRIRRLAQSSLSGVATAWA